MDSKPKWKRGLLYLTAFILACIVYLWFFGPQTFFALWTRNIGRKMPIVKSVPVSLEDLTISTMHGERLSFKGAEFEVPWDDIDEKKTRIGSNFVSVQFRSGRGIILFVSPPNGFISGLSKDKVPDPKVFAAMYGPEVLRSDYALHKAIFETTPSQITLSTSSNRAAGLSMVILVKAVMPPTTDWAIYNIRSKDFRGFQLGNPAHRPKQMCLELYADDVEFEFTIFQSATGPTPSITQAELNRIIQTAHKTPNAQPILTVNPS